MDNKYHWTCISIFVDYTLRFYKTSDFSEKRKSTEFGGLITKKTLSQHLFPPKFLGVCAEYAMVGGKRRVRWPNAMGGTSGVTISDCACTGKKQNNQGGDRCVLSSDFIISRLSLGKIAYAACSLCYYFNEWIPEFYIFFLFWRTVEFG